MLGSDAASDGPLGRFGRLKVVLLALLFVAFCLGVKLGPWYALAFLGRRSVARPMLSGLLALAGAVGLTALARRWRPTLLAPDLVLLARPSAVTGRRVIGGLLVGAALFVVVYGIARATGGIAPVWHGRGATSSTGGLAGLFAAMFVATALNAAWEEYTFRGWAFSASVRALGPHLVAVTLGSLFGLAHLLNPTATVAAVVSTTFAGLLLSYGMLAAGDIALPIGLHVGWNFNQSALTTRRLWALQPSGNAVLSGGRYGLEASLTGIGVTGLAATIALLLFVRRARRR